MEHGASYFDTLIKVLVKSVLAHQNQNMKFLGMSRSQLPINTFYLQTK